MRPKITLSAVVVVVAVALAAVLAVSWLRAGTGHKPKRGAVATRSKDR